MSELSLLVALVIALGIVGILVPVLPGVLIVLAAIVVWGLVVGGAAAWLAVAAAGACLLASQVLKYLIPGRNLRGAGVPRTSLVIGAALGIVGFFVIPVVGLVIGFVAGVYAAERRRLKDKTLARAATVGAIRAVGLSILIELAGALMAAGIWLAAAIRLT
jgi:uncharacterized protein YqgC (DUF456 family)